MMNVLIVIPAYNEAENIENVLNEIKADFAECDIVVINDCSPDQTESIVQKSNVPCITQPFNMGYASALQTGFKYAVRGDYEYVIQFDGDGQHIAQEAKKLYEYAVRTQSDIVIGSRFIENTGYANTLFRSLGSKIFSALIKIFCGQRIMDPTSGLQVLNRSVFTRYSKMNGYPDYPDANLLIEVLKASYLVREIPVKMRQRTAGVSMHSGIIKPIKYMVLMTYSIMIVLFKRRIKK